MFAIIGINPIATISVQIIKNTFPQSELCFVDDDPAKKNKQYDNGVPVLFTVKELMKEIESGKKMNLSISFGEKLLAKRKLLFGELSQFKNVSFPILKHDTAIISEISTVHAGNIFSFGAIIGHNAMLHANSVFWAGVVVEHDTTIGESCYLGPNVTISGFVKIGDCTLIGSGATVMPGVEIGCNCTVGAGAVVTKDIPDNSIVAGVPAKIIRTCN